MRGGRFDWELQPPPLAQNPPQFVGLLLEHGNVHALDLAVEQNIGVLRFEVDPELAADGVPVEGGGHDLGRAAHPPVDPEQGRSERLSPGGS